MAAPPAEAPWTTDPEVEKYLSELPSGYRFRPTDGELVVDYLRNKILDVPMPLNRIRTFKIYEFHPFELYQMYGATERENACYFFTTRKKKYPKGKRTARTAGKGFWKSTTGDQAVVVGDTTVGWKRSLVYHQGPATDSVKTDWLMQEYTLNYKSLPTPITKRKVADDYVLVKIYHKNMMKSNFSIPAPQVLQQDLLQDNNAVAADHQQEDNDKALVPITIVVAESHHHNQDSDDEGMEEYHHNNMNNNSSFVAPQVPDYNDEDFIEGMNLLILHQDNEGMINLLIHHQDNEGMINLLIHHQDNEGMNLLIHQQEETPLLLLPNDHHQHHPHQDDSGKNDDGMNNHQEDKSLLTNAYTAAQSSSSSSSSQYNEAMMMNFLIQQEEINPTLPNTSPTHHQHEHDDAPNDDHLHYLLNDNREAQHQHQHPCVAQDYVVMLSDFASGDERLQVESSALFPTSPIRNDDDWSYPLEDFCDIWSESYHQDLMFAPQDAAYDAHYYHELDNNNKRQRLI